MKIQQMRQLIRKIISEDFHEQKEVTKMSNFIAGDMLDVVTYNYEKMIELLLKLFFSFL
jgi:hypothetical protein